MLIKAKYEGAKKLTHQGMTIKRGENFFIFLYVINHDVGERGLKILSAFEVADSFDFKSLSDFPGYKNEGYCILNDMN
jgi:hypothetical protein